MAEDTASCGLRSAELPALNKNDVALATLPLVLAGTGRPMAEVVLTDEERATLVRWSRRAKSSQVLAQRCRIVLACAEELSRKDVAERLRVDPRQ